MNNEELKQRLIELAEEWDKQDEIDHLFDFFIANGVTILERGEWKKHPHAYECSLCGRAISVDYAEYYDAVEFLDLRFCPYCGADMRGGKDE
jgi:hypothetical protein